MDEPRNSTDRPSGQNTLASGINLNAEVHSLDNGLQVLLHRDSAHPLVSVQVWIRAGSLHEEAWGGAGLAHCLEHMLFKGTPTRSAERISQEIQELGGYVNAYTSFNRTVYWIDGLAENLKGYLDVLGDMVRNATLDGEELEREKEVIRREMAMDHDDPESTLQHLMLATVFRKHPLRHPIIGHREIFDQLGPPEVRAFKARHYVPGNTFVVISGDIDTQGALAAMDSVFGNWPRRPCEPPILPEEPPLKGGRKASRQFTSEQHHLACGWIIPGESHPDKPALDVLAFLLGSGRSSRLYQSLHQAKGIAHDVWAGAWCAPETGLFQVEADCQPDDALACRAGLFEEVERVARDSVTEEELEKAIRATVSSQLKSLSTTRGQAAILGHSWLTVGSLEYPARYLSALATLQPSDIQQVAARYLDRDNVCEAEVGPSAGPSIARASGASEPRDQSLNMHQLDNGLTLILCPNPRLPLISLRAQFLSGILVENAETAGVSQVTTEMLIKGTNRRSAAQIASELENLGGHLRCSADAHRLVLGADVMKGDEGSAIDLIHDLAANAVLPETQLPDVLKHQIAAIQEERLDPLTVALRRCRRELFRDLPFERTALGSEQSVNSLTTETCHRLLGKTLRGQNGVVTVFGDFDPQSLTDTLSSSLGTLPAGSRAFDASQNYEGQSKPGRWEDQLDKEQAVLVVGFRTHGLLHPDAPVLALIDEACSDMGSRLFNRIREELGLAYYVGAQSFSAMGAGAFYFYLGTSFDKLDGAEAELLQIIGEISESGLTDDELSRAKTTWKSTWLRAQQGNAAMADVHGWNELNGHGPERFQSLPAIMESVTGDDVARVAGSHLHPDSAFTCRVVPKG